MAGLLTVEVRHYRDVRGRFARRTEELRRARREEIRRLGRSGVSNIRHYAPEDTGEFARGVRYRATDRGSATTLTFYVSGRHAWLVDILTGGTRPHEIPTGGSAAQLAKGYPLHWIDRQSGEHRFAWSVWHPGTLPDPFMALAMDAMSPQFAQALARTAHRVVWL